MYKERISFNQTNKLIFLDFKYNVILFLIENSHTTYSRKKSQSNSNGSVTSHSSSKGMKSMFDDNNFEISVVLDNVPDYHHIPGVTTIIVEYVFIIVFFPNNVILYSIII